MNKQDTPQSNSLETTAKRLNRSALSTGLIVMTITIASCSTWIANAPLDAAIFGDGELQLINQRTSVQHQEGGIISKVHVREGSNVNAGQVLIEMVDKTTDANLGIVNSNLDALHIRRARLLAERNQKKEIIFPQSLDTENAKVQAAMETERQAFDSNRNMLQTHIALINSQISDAKTEISGIRREIQQTEQAYNLIQAEIANAESLVSQNYMAGNRLSELKRQAAEYSAQLENKRTRINLAKKRIASFNLRKQETNDKYVNIASNQLAELDNRERNLLEQQRPLLDTVNRQKITARVSGTVLAMQALQPGSVLAPGAHILDLVPAQDEFMIKARVAISDIDELYAGQQADIRFNAFPARTTPLVAGVIKHISADRLFDEIRKESFFQVEITLNMASLESSNLPPLHPGMSATVYMKTTKRTVLDYLLNPIITFQESAMRET